MAHVRVVLVRPEHPANVGAVARIIRNTGLDGLDLVAPGDWRTLECWRTAWGATQVLDDARERLTLGEAIADCGYVAAFSRRRTEAAALDVREAAAQVATQPEPARVALVFGPESSGLTLDEVALCGRSALIPSHPDQPSLNLSHAVMVAAYEVFRAGRPAAAARPLATHAQKEQTLALLFRGLRALRAMSDPRRSAYARLWRALLQRIDFSPRELRLIAHMARKMGAGAGPPEIPEGEVAQPLSPTAGGPNPYTDVLRTDEGFSLPLLKWRELLFVGALRREGELYVRDPARPLPLFEQGDLFPDDARFECRRVGPRVELRRRA
jgi:tRNA/rRNA methyltransferase